MNTKSMQAILGSSDESEIVMPGVANNLFWMLPGPNAFLDQVTDLLSHHRAVVVHMAERTVLGHHLMVERALARAQFDGAPPTTLRVHDASQIDCDIAQHLCVNDSRRHISPAMLTEWNTRSHQIQTGEAAPHTYVLRPRGSQALKAACEYLTEFAKALPDSKGNTRLILVRIDNDPTSQTIALKNSARGQLATAVFEGALEPDEMHAYLGMRMAISGTDSADRDVLHFPMNRLARALVAEFAGFDAHFAEGLMNMSDEELISLPHSLGALAARLPVSDTVWRQASEATVQSETKVHTMYLWHLASHAGPHQRMAARELNRRTWCAQLYSLMPWFEQLRHTLIGNLRPLLSAYLAPTNGCRVRVNQYNGREYRTPIEELECNDIASMVRDELPLQPRTPTERAALDLCVRVGRVRNEIAHMRPPKVMDLQELLSELENYQRIGG